MPCNCADFYKACGRRWLPFNSMIIINILIIINNITLPAIIIQLNDHHQYLHHHPHISLIIIITFNFTNNTSLTLLPGCIISASISNSSSLLNCDCATFTEQTERKVGWRANERKHLPPVLACGTCDLIIRKKSHDWATLHSTANQTTYQYLNISI